MHLARLPRIHLVHPPAPRGPVERLSEALGVENRIKREHVVANPHCVGDAPCPELPEPLRLARKGAFAGERVVFVHTGGAAGLFGYDFAFDHGARWVHL